MNAFDMIMMGSSGPEPVYTHEPTNSMLTEATGNYLYKAGATPSTTKEGILVFTIMKTATGYLYIYGTKKADNSNNLQVYLSQAAANETLHIYIRNSSTGVCSIDTDAFFRDQNGFVQFIVSFKTDEATASDRIWIYANGVLCPWTGGTIPASTINPTITEAETSVCGGATWLGPGHACDYGKYEGVSLQGGGMTLDQFGQFSEAIPELWTLADLSGLGAYAGANGFLQEYQGAGMGTDTYEVNDYTEVGTAEKVDNTPTNRFAVLNSLSSQVNPNASFTSNGVYSNGNLRLTAAQKTYNYVNGLGTLAPTSGKFYFEATLEAGGATNKSWSIGIAPAERQQQASSSSYAGQYFANTSGTIYEDYGTGGSQSGLTAFAENDVVAVAFDCDAGTIQFYLNGSAHGVEITGVDITGWTPLVRISAGANAWGGAFLMNFGDGGFTHTPPTGFLALSTANLPEPETLDHSQLYAQGVFVAATSANTIVDTGIDGLASKGFMARLKANDSSIHWICVDTVRGLTKSSIWDLGTKATIDEITVSGSTLTIPDSVLTDGIEYLYEIYVVDPDHFDIQVFTGTAAAHAEDHDLNSAPGRLAVISSGSVTGYHEALGATKAIDETTGTAAGTSAVYWNDVPPTTTQFTVGTSSLVNESGTETTAYLWANSDVYNMFSITGNASGDGPFISTGGAVCAIPLAFDSSVNFTSRTCFAAMNEFNPVEDYLELTRDNVGTAVMWDFLSNGAKIRTPDATVNASGSVVVGMAVNWINQKYA